MTITKTENFGMQRKIVANMTSESWETIPHVSYQYEADVTPFLNEFKRLNANRKKDEKISINTVLMKVICEGLKAAPEMNGHIEYKRKLVRGQINQFKEINISMPVLRSDGETVTVNLRDFGDKSLDEMTAYIADLNRKFENTNLQEAMFEVSLDNTIKGLKKGKVLQALQRIIGSKTGKNRVKLLNGSEKKSYYSISETDRLTKKDLEQGTVTISNIGSIYKEQSGLVALLEIIPPQICAFAIGAIQEKPAVITNDFGKKEIAIRKMLPICIAFDHRALDFAGVVPFIKTLDETFENPSVIHDWTDKTRLIIKKFAI